MVGLLSCSIGFAEDKHVIIFSAYKDSVNRSV